MSTFAAAWARWAPLLLCLLLSGPAWSQSDSGQWEILEARYGTAERNIDVTQRLRELARNDTAFRVTNDLFGRDPHPNVPKTLRIHARGRGGATHTFEYAENQLVHGTLYTGWTGGNWGQGGGGGWGGQGGNRPVDGGQWEILEAHYGTAQRSMDVTQRLKELARRSNSFQVSNDQFGRDPYPQEVKTLRIRARRADGATRTFDYAEGQYVHGAMFRGWSGGNWGQGGGNAGWGDQATQLPGSGGQVEILSARYGTPERNMDVTQQLRALAQRHSSFRVSNDQFGRDPHPNAVKTLRIRVRNPDGSTRAMDYAEGQFVHGDAFTGWSGGNWGRNAGGDSGW